jgi:hypothetical protein
VYLRLQLMVPARKNVLRERNQYEVVKNGKKDGGLL